MTASSAGGDRRVTVWDPLVRLSHWLLVAAIVLAWFTRHGGWVWHEAIGYASLAIVGVRLIWGVVGQTQACFATFIQGPRATLAYASQFSRGKEPRYLGHNPLGGWMIVALIAGVILVGASGWLYTTDRYWGVEWVETLHRQLTHLLFILVALHIAGVIYASFRHGENLVASMFHGRKDA